MNKIRPHSTPQDRINYWRDHYGARDTEFVAGVKAGIKAYAVWKDGAQRVGIFDTLLKEAFKEVDDAFQAS